MIKKGLVQKICLCCGEKKPVKYNASYCVDCSSTPHSALFSAESTNKGTYSMGARL